MNESSIWFRQLTNVLSKYRILPNDIWNYSKNYFIKKELNKDEFFVKPGEFFTKLGFILNGGIRSFIIDKNGNEKITDFCLQNEFINNHDIFNHKNIKSTEWISAFENTELAVIKAEDLRWLTEKFLEIKDLINALLMDYYNFKQNRIAQLMAANAVEKYRIFKETYPDLENRVSQYFIACYLGIAPETLSRIKRKT